MSATWLFAALLAALARLEAAIDFAPEEADVPAALLTRVGPAGPGPSRASPPTTPPHRPRQAASARAAGTAPWP